MKSRSLSLIITLILLLIIGGVFVITRPDTAIPPNRSNEPIPYIYYYSDLEHAFVIERADGTDSRLLGQDVLPEDHNVIDSVHWSPSGEYLAWRSHRHNGPGAYAISGWLVGSDGRYISDLLDDAINVFLMEWAPDKDWLVVGFSGNIFDSYETIRVIDVPNNRIVNEVTSNGVRYMDPPFYRGMPEAWSEDGASIYFAYSHFGGTSLTKLGINGITEQWYFDTRDPLRSFNGERLMNYDYVSRDGSYQTDWIITDLTTGEMRTYREVENAYLPEIDFDVHWNSDRSYALVTEKPCEEDDYGYKRCHANLLTLFQWETGEVYNLPDHLRLPQPDYYYMGDDVWSPDGTVAVLVDDTASLHLLDSSTQEIIELDIHIGTYDNWYWLPGNDLLLSTTVDNESSISHYDWQTRTLSDANYLETNALYSLSFSPDFSFVGYDGGDVRVHNLNTGEIYRYPRHSRTSYGGPVTNYKWHESNEWFFAGSNTQIVDSCCNSRAITIHNLEQPVGRELTLCYGVQTCAGFVPDNVLTHLNTGQETSYTPEPLHVLLHDTYVQGVVWNADGTQLITYSRYPYPENRSIVSVWDMTQDTPELVNSIPTELECSSHNSLCPIDWLDANTVQIPLYTYEDRQQVYYLQQFNLVSGETVTRSLSYNERLAFYQISEYYIPFVPYEDDVEQPAYLVRRDDETRVFDIPMENITAWQNMPVSYDEASGLMVYSTVYDRGGIWNAQTGERLDIMNWTGHTAQLSPDGTRLAVAGSRFVSIWDMTPYIEQVNNR